MTDPILQLDGIKKSFGGNHVLPGLDFEVGSQKVTALIGPNGAGKTTIFNVITGFYRAEQGEVRLKGSRIDALSPERIFRLGVARTFQDLRLFSGMTVMDNAVVGRERGIRSIPKRKENREIVMDRLALFGLDNKAKHLASDLSYAEQKFLSLARALSCDAELLLLDEPTSGLDGKSLELVMGIVTRLYESNQTVLIVEHNLDVVKELSDWIIFLDQGKSIAEGTADDLFRRSDLSDIYFGSVTV